MGGGYSIERFIPIVALLESEHANKQSGIRIDDAFVTFRLQARGTQVHIHDIQVSAVIDDIGVGGPLHKSDHAEFDMTRYLASFREKFVSTGPSAPQRTRMLESMARMIRESSV